MENELTPTEELLRRELADTRRQLRDARAEGAASLAIAQAIRDTVPSRPRVAAARTRTKTKTHSNYEGLFHIADVHYGEVVRSSSTGGLAEYNPDIARARVEAATQEAIDIGRYMKIGKMVYLATGDNMSGLIHADLERSNAEMLVQQTLDMSEIMADSIQMAAEHFPIDFDGRSGNHPRLYTVPFFNRKQVENMDYMLYQFLEKTLKNQKSIKFLTNESFWNVIEAGNRKFLTMHGDTIKHQNSMSLPWYSMFKELMKWMGMREQGGVPWFDDMLIGHFHNQATIQMGNSTLRVAPAVKGPDDYSYAGSRMPTPAGARFLTVAEGEVKSDHIIELR